MALKTGLYCCCLWTLQLTGSEQRWAASSAVISTQWCYFQLCRSVVNSPSRVVSPEWGVRLALNQKPAVFLALR